ncbi:hypothetical protein ACIQVR_26870 [Streptomyces xanthochromogenes]|uniref:hypothetical protein n=1 Tax=Streptomyces xanthochromogenes TaxID=67384 RepID=UPI0038156ABD
MNTFEFDPHFEWFEELDDERRLERQVLALVGAHERGLEAKRLGELLDRTHRDRWAPVYDKTWDLQRRGLLVISPEPDQPEGKPCTYTLTETGEALLDEIREQAHTCSKYWREQRPDLPDVMLVDNTEGNSTRTVSWHFHNLVTDSGSMYFATWSPGEHFVRLWSPDGMFRDVLSWNPRTLASTGDVQELAGAWGPVGLRIEQHRLYPNPEA